VGLKSNIELHIEELILHGFREEDRYRIGEAIQIELSRLLAEGGVPSPMIRGSDYPMLTAGLLHLSPHSDAKIIGSQIAGALYESFQPTTNHKERR